MISNVESMSMSNEYLFHLVAALEAAHIALVGLPGFNDPGGGGSSKKREGNEQENSRVGTGEHVEVN